MNAPRLASVLGLTGSWGSVKGGKWHQTVSATPGWRKEKTVCGLTIAPLNVTHGKPPSTNECFLCKHCWEAQ